MPSDRDIWDWCRFVFRTQTHTHAHACAKYKHIVLTCAALTEFELWKHYLLLRSKIRNLQRNSLFWIIFSFLAKCHFWNMSKYRKEVSYAIILMDHVIFWLNCVAFRFWLYSNSYMQHAENCTKAMNQIWPRLEQKSMKNSKIIKLWKVKMKFRN